MKLHEYPGAIATAQRHYYTTRRVREDLDALVTDVRARIEGEIAFDTGLKNDSQRKAALAERIREDSQLAKATASWQEAQAECNEAEVKLNQIAAEFTVAKLQMQKEIAQLQLQSATSSTR